MKCHTPSNTTNANLQILILTPETIKYIYQDQPRIMGEAQTV